MVQNDKKSSAPYLRNYIHLYMMYMVHLCKTIISPSVVFFFVVVFFIFSKFWFFGSIGELKGQKTVQNDKKIMPVSLHIWRMKHHLSVHWGMNSPPQKHPPLLFLPNPPLNMQTVQGLPFKTISPYILLFGEPSPINWIFQWSPIISGFSVWGMWLNANASAHT